MSPDRDIADLLNLGLVCDEKPGAFVILQVNPLVNRLIECLREPVQLQISEDLYGDLRKIGRRVTVRSKEELEVLLLLRSGEYSKVIIQLADGMIARTDAESQHGARSIEQLAELMEEEEFQTVTLTKQHGEVVRVTRTKPYVTGRKR